MEDARGLRIVHSRITNNGWGYRRPAVEIVLGHSAVEVDECAIGGNYAGLSFLGCEDGMVKNSCISGNGRNGGQTGHGVSSERSRLLIDNCTLAENTGRGLYYSGSSKRGEQATVSNSIIWGNGSGQISGDSGLMTVTYSNIEGGWPGQGNIDADPLFAHPGFWVDADDSSRVVDANDPNATWVAGDYHLKSQAGRFDPDSGQWVLDEVTSPCIDAGDPNDSVGLEPSPNGGRINMGAYGGTAEASKSTADVTQ
jgi:hypothetical protein